LTNRVHNQIIFWNLDTLKEYYDYSSYIQGSN